MYARFCVEARNTDGQMFHEYVSVRDSQRRTDTGASRREAGAKALVRFERKGFKSLRITDVFCVG